ncbi:MAG: hypothetical protein C4334_12170 [Pyrinomonas sp.]|uniref:polysaccharide deacetylase family protein n=1 Tax=Pyrinomonas sp. TaxID=2080306 RepID=UPI003321AE89
MNDSLADIIVVPRECFCRAETSLQSIYENTQQPFSLIYVDGNSPRRIKRWPPFRKVAVRMTNVWRGLKRSAKRFELRFKRQALILVYHRIGDSGGDPWKLSVSPSHFKEHLEVLRRFYRTASLRQIISDLQRGRLKRQCVVITFDDGYRDNLIQAKPLLERYDVPATVFVISGFIGQSGEAWWDELEKLLLQPKSLPPTLRLEICGGIYERRIESCDGDHAQFRSWNAWTEAPPTLRHALYLELYGILRKLSTEERTNVMNLLRA